MTFSRDTELLITSSLTLLQLQPGSSILTPETLARLSGAWTDENSTVTPSLLLSPSGNPIKPPNF